MDKQPPLKPIAIAGAGGFGKETLVMLRQINALKPQWDITGFYDDGFSKGIEVAGLKVLGGIDELNQVRDALNVVVAVGDPRVRKGLVARIKNGFLLFPTLVHPAATMGDGIKSGIGCIIAAGCRLTIDIVLEDFVLLNLNTTVGHDVHIGPFGSVMPGVHLSGYVNVGEGVLIGTGASVLQYVKIGDGAVVGAGAVVTKDVKVGKTVAGVPARGFSL